MTIYVAALLIAQPASTLDVVVPNAIVDLHNKYVLCQDQAFDAGKVRDRTSFKTEVERSIAACTAEKRTLMQQAESRLASAPDFQDRIARQRAISEAFDGYDRVRHLMARQ